MHTYKYKLLCAENIVRDLQTVKFEILKTMEKSSLVQAPVEKLTNLSIFIPCCLRMS